MRPRRSSLRLAATLSLLSVLGLALPPVSGAALSSVPDATAGAAVNGTVTAIVRSPARTYLGGNFHWAGTPMAGGAAVSAGTGLRQDFAGVTAGPTAASTAVSAVISDGDDGFYIGGNFTAVAGQPVTNLAHIKKDGGLDTTFAPSPNGAGERPRPVGLRPRRCRRVHGHRRAGCLEPGPARRRHRGGERSIPPRLAALDPGHLRGTGRTRRGCSDRRLGHLWRMN